MSQENTQKNQEINQPQQEANQPQQKIENQGERTVVLTEKTFIKTLEYLSQQPFYQVANLIAELQQVKIVEEK